MRHYLLTLSAIFLLMASCSKENLSTDEAVIIEPTTRLSKAEINDFAKEKYKTEGLFKWEMASDEMIWSAISHGHEIATVGYQPLGYEDIENTIHEIDISASAWSNVKEDLLDLILTETQKHFPGQEIDLASLLVIKEEKVIPAFYIIIKHPSIVRLLRERADVRYVEPMEYSYEEVNSRSDAGCGVGPNYNIPYDAYSTISPNAKVPWNFSKHNIPQAWNVSQGDNIGICVIDTGTSPNQPKVGSQFSSGQSAGRYIVRDGFFTDSWWWWASPDGPNDDCGHGTQMSGLATAPRGADGSTVGVAYKANLIAYRATDDVIINASAEKNGVKDALIAAGNRSDVKIISMSLGDIFWSSTVADGIYYAYNRGKLIFAAAGTSTFITGWAVGVIFPANMSQTVACTGVRDQTPMRRCNTCHDGNAVDFVVTMQDESNTSYVSLTLAMSGNIPASVSGSSTATATTAGIAALVWATNPYQSRSTVLNRMKKAASFYPYRNSKFGWGAIDAHYAVTNY